jgi:signal transduction histidine kinase
MIRNLQIRSKLIAILVTPLIALTVLASLAIGANVARGVQADRVNDETAFALNLSQLVHELQRERDLSAGWVGSGRRAGYGGVVAQRVASNQALADFRRDVEGLSFEDDDSVLRQRVDTALAKLGKLNDERQRIEDNPTLTVAKTLDFYSGIINDLLAVDLEIATQTDDRDLIRNVSTFVALARFKEAVSLERGFLNAAASAGRFGQGEFQRLATIIGAQDTWRAQFDATASPEQRAFLDQALRSRDVQEATALREPILLAGPAAQVSLDPKPWFRYMSAKLDLLRGVERKLADDVTAASQAAQSSASRQALLYTVILTIVLWVTVGLSLLLARSMVGPLRTLTRSANDVAERRLPGLVDRLQQSTDTDLRDLEVVPEPVPVTSNDEIGQVSAAFNSVHRVAIQVATEQAALRKSIGDMFLNLARRSQSLIDRQLELIDDLERTEADPDALENLFHLDHLATRMRRNAEDLIVLSGAEPARRWSQPVPLVDVVRAALGEVEDYNRVELLSIDEVGVAGQTVSDVVHLLAELIENATSFSPPGTKVQIAGQQVSNGYVLEIEDRGLGMSDEELVEANERLANPPMVDFALSRMLGLYVVGRLAQRYGIKVQLRHSWYGGITALVLLPPTLVVRAAVDMALEAGPRRTRGELVPTTKPAEPPPLSGDHLPIFEAARSDWFDSGVRGDHLPLRRHAAQQPGGRTGGPAGNGAGGLPDGATGHAPTPGDPRLGEFPVDAPATPANRADLPPADAPRDKAEPEPVDAQRAEAAPAEPEVVAGPRADAEPDVVDAPRADAEPDLVDAPRADAEPDLVDAPRADAEPEVVAGPRADAEPDMVDAPRPPAEAPRRAPPRRTGAPSVVGPLPTRTPGATAPPSPAAPAPSGPAPTPPPPTRPARRAGSRTAGQPPPTPADTPPLTPASVQAASVQTTKAGLPRRVPRANLAPGIVAAKATASAAPSPTSTSTPPPSSASRSPEEVRSMLSSYRSGLERGRMMAAGEDAVPGSDAPSSPRSDDDATQ